jgi:hypothetical protein
LIGAGAVVSEELVEHVGVRVEVPLAMA